jgi:hypothetical protein
MKSITLIILLFLSTFGYSQTSIATDPIQAKQDSLIESAGNNLKIALTLRLISTVPTAIGGAVLANQNYTMGLLLLSGTAIFQVAAYIMDYAAADDLKQAGLIRRKK